MLDSQSYQEIPSSVLRQYVDGRLTTAELDSWLSEAEYDDSLPTPLKDLLASVRLVILEAGEGSASKDDVLTTVALALASMEPDTPIVLQRASASTTWSQPSSSFTATATPVVRGRISAGTGA
jgi:hypothetical protein